MARSTRITRSRALAVVTAIAQRNRGRRCTPSCFFTEGDHLSEWQSRALGDTRRIVLLDLHSAGRHLDSYRIPGDLDLIGRARRWPPFHGRAAHTEGSRLS